MSQFACWVCFVSVFGQGYLNIEEYTEVGIEMFAWRNYLLFA